jgi:NADH-quinone oxidoreductase subunit N
MAQLAGPDDSDQELDHYAGLARRDPFLATVLAVGLGSLAGIPPLAGFVGKFLVFASAFRAGHYLLLVLALAGVVVSIYYYFGWIKAACFESPRAEGDSSAPGPAPVNSGQRLALAMLALASVVLGFYQGPLGRWLSW